MKQSGMNRRSERAFESGDEPDLLGGLLKKWLTIALLLCVSPAEAQWGPDSTNYDAEARVIGTWKGTFSGQSFEFAIWPSRQNNDLSGVMVWGDCKAVIKVSGFEFSGNQQLAAANPDLGGYMYSLRSFPNQIRDRTNQCPGEGRPGYSTFLLNGDVSNGKLEMFGYGTYPKLKKYPSEVARSAPSGQLAQLLSWRDQKTSDRVSTMAKEAVFDPAVSYLSLSEKQVPTRLESAAGLTFVSVTGVQYEFKLTQAGKTREFHDLIVLNTDQSSLQENPSVGETAGTVEFVRASQEVRIRMHRKIEGCGVVKDPVTSFDLENNRGVSADFEELGQTGKSWVLRSPKGRCAAILVNGYCKVQSCTQWWGERVKDPWVVPIITDSPKIADRQAGMNWISWQAN